MILDLKYGTGTIGVHIPDSAEAVILEPNHIEPVASIRQALVDELAGLAKAEPALLHAAAQATSVAIAIPDETRPLPVKKVLPILLDWLFDHIPELAPSQGELIGGGLHPPLDSQTQKRLRPPILPGLQGCCPRRQ